MKRLIMCMLLAVSTSTMAVGPNMIHFNGLTYTKGSEKNNGSSISATYYPNARNARSSIVLTQVFDKSEPQAVIKNLRTKKSVEIIEVAPVQSGRSDMLVSFIKFDMPNRKVENNIARIQSRGQGRGSWVFQYVDTQRLGSSQEGAKFPDLSSVAESMKQVSLNNLRSEQFIPGRYDDRSLPWYKRRDARAGQGSYGGGY